MICPFSLLLINPLYFFCYYLFIYYNIIYFLIPIVKQQCQWLYHSVIYMMILLFNHHSQTKNKLFYYIICQRFIWYNNLYSVLRVILSQSLLKLFWKLFIFCQHACLASQNWQSIDNFATNVLNNHMQRTVYSLVRPSNIWTPAKLEV